MGLQGFGVPQARDTFLLLLPHRYEMSSAGKLPRLRASLALVLSPSRKPCSSLFAVSVLFSELVFEYVCSVKGEYNKPLTQLLVVDRTDHTDVYL